jgi:hypothetical protein
LIARVLRSRTVHGAFNPPVVCLVQNEPGNHRSPVRDRVDTAEWGSRRSRSWIYCKRELLTGSYARSTMISLLKEADVDIFCVLDVSYYSRYSGPGALLDAVRNTLLRTYTTTPSISRNGQPVGRFNQTFIPPSAVRSNRRQNNLTAEVVVSITNHPTLRRNGTSGPGSDS